MLSDLQMRILADRAGFHLPDLGRVLGDREVARKLAGPPDAAASMPLGALKSSKD